jgi:hypothetical protein
MKSKQFQVGVLALGLVLALAASAAAITQTGQTAQPSALSADAGYAFTYQGRLSDAGGLVTGTCDFLFQLYDSAGTGSPPTGGTSLGTEDKDNVNVDEGLFVVQFDFGSSVFTGEERWLEIAVDCGEGPTTFSQRQELTPTPYAIHSWSAGTVPWSGLTGIPADFADEVDNNTQLSESEVEAYVTNDPLDLAEGTTLGGETISTLVSGGCDDIQTAINNLPASGGQIVVQAGTYTCSTSIVIDRDNVDLRGQGPATVLRLADHANLPLLVLGQAINEPTVTRSNIYVSDLTLDGNRENQDSECYSANCDEYPIRNNGITLRRVSDVLVERVTVIGARSGGLVAEHGCRRITVHDLTAADSNFDGLAGYLTEDSKFTGLYLHNNCAAGLSFDLDFDNNIISDVIILRDEDRTCETSDPPELDGTVGVFMRDSRDNVFHGIQIRNSREHGIFLAQEVGLPDSAATGNTFSGMVISGSGGAGLRANDPTVVNTLVVESQFVGNSSGCISEAVAGQVQVFGIICR